MHVRDVLVVHGSEDAEGCSASTLEYVSAAPFVQHSLRMVNAQLHAGTAAARAYTACARGRYESGSMTALANRTGDEAQRAAFASQAPHATVASYSLWGLLVTREGTRQET